MHQLTMPFARARREDPVTSHAAADLVREFEGEHFAKVLKGLAEGSATIYELADRAGLTHVQVARRMPELEQAGRVRIREGEKRKSPTGRPCRVWEVAA
jgi:predicted ArsR family transcriptional regulator